LTIQTIADLKPDPHNARKHNPRNLGMVINALHEVGAARSIVIDENGVILAGNGVVEAAADAGIERVQVVDADGETIIAVRRTGLTDKQKTRLALFDNRAAELAEWDAETIAADLEAGVELGDLFDGDELDKILGAANPEDDEGETPEPEYDYVPNARFPTDNVWDVPTLDAKLQALQVELPFQTWGSKAGGRKRQMNGTYHFYTDDLRFEALWTDPMPVVLSGCHAAVEPNFTVSLESPRAFVLWNVYRKRWMARYWQTEGVRVFVDLNVPAEYADLTFLGVPKEWRAYITRGYSDRTEATVNEWRAACEHHGDEDIFFTVYGGGKAVKQMCSERGWGWLPEERDVVKGKVDG
jgi:hypothetical protein